MTGNDKGLRAAVIGCGGIARVQIGYLLRFFRPSAMALCDTNLIRMESLGEEFDISSRFSCFEEMLRQFRPDAVHILTPPYSHKEIALSALGDGCHVFL